MHLNACVLFVVVCPIFRVVQARDAKDAHIILWDVATMRPIQRLHGHSLTILQLEFSPNDKYATA